MFFLLFLRIQVLCLLFASHILPIPTRSIYTTELKILASGHVIPHASYFRVLNLLDLSMLNSEVCSLSGVVISSSVLSLIRRPACLHVQYHHYCKLRHSIHLVCGSCLDYLQSIAYYHYTGNPLLFLSFFN